MVIACVNSVHGHYMKAIGPSPVYIAHLKGSFDHISDRELVTKAWELVHEVQKKRDLEELSWVAETSPRLSNLVDDIWAQVHEGRGHILYVERDKQQAGMIENSHATVLGEQLDHIPAIDLVDAIIEEQINHGGEIRIVPNGTLERFGGIALKTRY